jgi:hypothetical protein
MRKNRSIFMHFEKSKNLFFANIYYSPFCFYCNDKKCIKLKPPTIPFPLAEGERQKRHKKLEKCAKMENLKI